MNTKIKFLSTMLLFAALWNALCLQSCKEEALEITGNIEGNVVDLETQENLSGVNITIVSNSSTTFAEQSKLTGSDGKFSFKDLEAGNYKLTFAKEGYESNSKNIALAAGQTSSSDVSLKPIKSAISVSPTLLDFGQESNILPLEIRNTGKGDLNWSIAEDLNWVSVNPVSGKATTEPASVSVTVDRSLITGDSKTGTIVINSNGGSVIVNITVGKAGPILNVTPATLNFGDVETEKTLNISNVGKETLTYEATGGQSWITLEGANGSATTDIKTIKVTVNRAGLATGEYTGNVIINSNSNSITIPVTMSVMQPSVPDLINGQASSVMHNTAQVSASITSPGSSAVTQHGHCWSVSPDPTTADNKTTLGGTSVTQSFTSNLTGLSPSTTYYVRAYATNSVGTKYSDPITFTTLAPPTMATVKTLRIENVKHNAVDAVGELTVLGDGFITDYGFCHSSSSASPTTADFKTSLGSTTNLGEFTGTVNGLRESTKYFVRAYATNSMGTAYGNVIETSTVDAPPLVTSGLVAYYTFDNENCNESRGRSEYNGIKQGNGNPVWSTDIPGKAGKSLQSNNDAYFYVADDPFKGYASTFSINLWVKTVYGNGTVILSHTSSYSPGVAIINDKIYCRGGETSFSDGFATPLITDLLPDGNWHMLTIINNNRTFSMYIDGIYLSQFYMQYNNINVGIPMLIARGLIGNLDNLRIYSRVLAASEITELYNAKQ